MNTPIRMRGVAVPTHKHYAYAYGGDMYFKVYECINDLAYIHPCLLESLDPRTTWRWGIYNPNTEMLQPFETYDAALMALALGCVP